VILHAKCAFLKEIVKSVPFKNTFEKIAIRKRDFIFHVFCVDAMKCFFKIYDFKGSLRLYFFFSNLKFYQIFNCIFNNHIVNNCVLKLLHEFWLCDTILYKRRKY